MAIVVETGAIVTSANSFVSIADAQAYFNARSITITITEAMLLKAMDILDPLECLSDYTLPLDAAVTIPAQLIKAQEWLCYYDNAGYSMIDAASDNIKSEKVDVLETEYFSANSTMGSIAEMPQVANNLRAMGCSSFTSGVLPLMGRA